MLFQGLKNIFHEFDSEPTVTLGYKTMMTSSKFLDPNYLELFLDTFFRRSNFSKRLMKMFCVIDSEPIVTLGYEVMMASSKCLDLHCFKLFSCVLFRINIISRD